MVADAGAIFRSFIDRLRNEGFRDSLFVMGRSLGSMPAIEVALRHQDEIRGLIVESGAASNFRRLWESFGTLSGTAAAGEESPFLNKVKVRQIDKPTLILHGEHDEIISVEEGRDLYRNSGAQDKRIVIVPGAGHNDIMMNQGLYFGAIEEFVKTHR